MMAPREIRPDTTALPVLRDGDGPRLCRKFCHRFGAPGAGAHYSTPHHGPTRTGAIPDRLRLIDGPALCFIHCTSFARRQPVTIYRPRGRGRQIAAKEGRNP